MFLRSGKNTEKTNLDNFKLIDTKKDNVGKEVHRQAIPIKCTKTKLTKEPKPTVKYNFTPSLLQITLFNIIAGMDPLFKLICGIMYLINAFSPEELCASSSYYNEDTCLTKSDPPGMAYLQLMVGLLLFTSSVNHINSNSGKRWKNVNEINKYLIIIILHHLIHGIGIHSIANEFNLTISDYGKAMIGYDIVIILCAVVWQLVI